MNKTIKVVGIFFAIIGLVSCGAISRKDMFNQKITIKDAETKDRVQDVQIFVNKELVGVTDEDGKVKFLVSEVNHKSTYDLEVKKDGYISIILKISNKVGGGYAFMDTMGLVLGLVPGIINLSVDGTSGKWYTFKRRLVLKLRPIKVAEPK